METKDALNCFAALAQGTRLAVFQILVRHEPDGLAAGEIARRLNVPHNTMSTHLAVLTRAGLALSDRRSRSIIYRADLDRIDQTIRFLVRDCCNGRPEICQPLLNSLTDCLSATDT